jgi:hypothetical protein
MTLNEIRQYVKQCLIEASISKHFNDRIGDRLEGDFTNFKDIASQREKDLIKNNIQTLKAINFGQENVLIQLLKSDKVFLYKKTNMDGTIEASTGNYVYALMKGNELDTIVFGKNTYMPPNMHYKIVADRIPSFINNVKRGDFNIDRKDLERMNKGDYGDKAIKNVPEKPLEIVYNINGVKWVLDKENELLKQKNKPEISFSINGAEFDNLSPEIQEDIIKRL